MDTTFFKELWKDPPKDAKVFIGVPKVQGGAPNYAVADVLHSLDTLDGASDKLFCPAMLTGDFGHTKDKFLASNVCWVDVDADITETKHKPTLPPSYIVETSPGHFHLYWLLDERCTDRDALEAANKLLTVDVGGDHCHDATHVLRVPGTLNSKRNGSMVTVIHSDTSYCYPLSDILALGQAGKRTRHKIKTGDRRGHPSRSERDLAIVGPLLRAGMSIETMARIFEHHACGDRYRGEDGTKGTVGLDYLGLTVARVEHDAREAPAQPPDSPAASKGRNAVISQLDMGLTDVGNADRLVEQYGKVLRWQPKFGWFMWDALRWRPIMECEIEPLALEIVRGLPTEAEGMTGADWVETLKWAVRSQAVDRIGAMIRLTRTLEPVKLDAGFQFDPPTTDYSITCLDGTIDFIDANGQPIPWDKLRVRVPDPKDFNTKCAPVHWDPSAKCPRFEQFLRLVYPDEEVRDWVLWKLARGTLATTSKTEVMIPWGTGNNGKTTLATLIARVFGDYVFTSDSTMLTQGRRRGAPTPELVKAPGTRMWFLSETEEGAKIQSNDLKRYSGGDGAPVRDLYEKGGETVVRQTWVMWMHTNHKPGIGDFTDAMWDRLRLVPHTTRFWIAAKGESGPEEYEADRQWAEKTLAVECEGIFALLLRKACETLVTPEPVCEAVLAATEEYRSEENVFGLFLEEETMEGGEVQKSVFFGRHKQWAGKNALGKKRFTAEMRARGYDEVHREDGDYWVGLSLRRSGPLIK